VTDDAAPDVFALIQATTTEPVGHLEGHVTARDEADLELLHAGTPQHARPSRRSADALGRILLALAVVTAVSATVIVAGEVVATPGWRRAEQVACCVLIAPGLVVLAAAAGCVALGRLEAWYERRRGGGSP